MNARKTICILSTGGTIAMHPSSDGYTFVHGDLKNALDKMPELQNADMPHFVVEEFLPLLDSANMTYTHWLQIGEFIQENYNIYDGFVILHGTDTMAYTASALSFMLENLNKPLILTGSQLPLFKTRSDARENLINALWLAGNYIIPEVCIYFNNKLFRGNRCKKMDANSFAAFASPNFPPLAKIGTEITFRKDLVLKDLSYRIPEGEQASLIKKNDVTSSLQSIDSKVLNTLNLQSIKPTVVSTFRLFPGTSFHMLEDFLHSPLQALVLETYGMGTGPEDPIFLNMIKQLTQNNILVINCSQCWRAKVKINDYTTGTALLNAGVIPGGDMTVEAAITKLFYLFSKYSSLVEIKSQFVINLRGELTC
ncbi:MAG: asparaginase [Gammaproteobacteria bacterium]|nr:asparaginase [Gammaproteobacteria bacterium]